MAKWSNSQPGCEYKMEMHHVDGRGLLWYDMNIWGYMCVFIDLLFVAYEWMKQGWYVWACLFVCTAVLLSEEYTERFNEDDTYEN